MDHVPWSLAAALLLLSHQILYVIASSSAVGQTSTAAWTFAQHRLRKHPLSAPATLVQVQFSELPSQGVGPSGCRQLEQAMLVQPKASCREVQLLGSWDGCSCTIPQPRSMNPWPDTFFNPSAIKVKLRKEMPTLPPIATLAPAKNPAEVYVAPRMEPECPFSRQCADLGDSTDCVGFDSWGFHSMRQEPYNAVAGHLNSITCTYMMDQHGQFQVPNKVEALWAALKQSG
mmetsp:Transcript_17770/g.44992  ORF Transcript_17770/g.44992 Transcript_17770/m.44992 type:complete len:230 (+) Transcript_17770:92-781(+)